MKRVRSLLRRVGGPFVSGHLSRRFASGELSDQQWVDLFAGNWASKLPLPGVTSGQSHLFDDARIRWFLDKIGGVEGKSVLELGPLEGGHSSMLQLAGASSVTGVEANALAWLKCLAVKERLELSRCHFLYGDFMEYLSTTNRRFDVTLASGVLYHLKDPQRLFERLRRCTSGPVFLWTMIWDPTLAHQHPALARRLRHSRRLALSDGTPLTLYRHEYGVSRWIGGFWGGTSSSSEWMTQAGVEASARAAGYDVTDWAFVEPAHVNGPALAALLTPR